MKTEPERLSPHFARHRHRYAIFLKCVLVGLASGFIVSLFRLALEGAEEFRAGAYSLLGSALAGPGPAGPIRLGLWLFALAVLGLAVGELSRRWPMIRGSGIPQLKGVLRRRLSFSWRSELPAKMAAGVAAIGGGLSLGREGPSIQIGALVADAALRLSPSPDRERSFLLSSGAAAGLAAAFNAPLAGVLFSLEELHRSFSPLMLVCAMGASVAGDLVSSRFFRLGPVFSFPDIAPLPLERYPLILVLGLLCALLGHLFKAGLYRAPGLYAELRVPPVLRPVLALLLSVPFGLFLFETTGGGHGLIVSTAAGHRALSALALLLGGKLLLTWISYGSGAAGGIFLPLLACGALAGDAFGAASALAGLSAPAERLNFLIIGMAAFFSAVVRAPVTGAVLILEMCGNFNHLSGLVAGCAAAYALADVMHSRGVYDTLLERLLGSPGTAVRREDGGHRTAIEVPVGPGSSLDGTLLREVRWPAGCLVVTILRGDSELVPSGSIELLAGDILVVLVPESAEAPVRDALELLAAPGA
jgi:H+/Cl- antiporter ClcA